MNNMIKRFGVTFGLVGLFVLGACGTDEATKSAETAPSMEPVEAELNVPATADKDEAVTLAVRVTQDGKAVDDADEIKFEVWKNGAKEASETTEAALTEDG
ncbi:MAG: FixH family protein, partial [Exiguobacterium chiriqhucha]